MGKKVLVLVLITFERKMAYGNFSTFNIVVIGNTGWKNCLPFPTQKYINAEMEFKLLHKFFVGMPLPMFV